MLTTATAVVNSALGGVYLVYALLTLDDLHRGRLGRGSTHLAWGFAAVMLTCGAHHVEHAGHVLAGQQVPAVIDLAVVASGLPVGLVWFWLRMEARRGGPGDRMFTGDGPAHALRAVAGVGTIAVVAALLWFDPADGWVGRLLRWDVAPNIAVALLYVAIAVVLGRTQLRRRAATGQWSVSGLALTSVFPTCAAMHAVWVGYVTAGTYQPEPHLLAIDLAAVPAAAWFIGVAWLLGEGRMRDDSDAGAAVNRPDGLDDVEDGPVPLG